MGIGEVHRTRGNIGHDSSVQNANPLNLEMDVGQQRQLASANMDEPDDQAVIIQQRKQLLMDDEDDEKPQVDYQNQY